MKTELRNILLVAMMLGTYAAYSNEILKVESTSITIKKRNHISISDAKGEVIYSGHINYNGDVTSLFDFTQLKDGIYRVEVNKDFEIEIHAVTVKNGILTFLQDFNEKIFKPVFRFEDSKVLISKLALDSEEMTVELYYENELIYTENVKEKEILNRVYELDETLRGDYKAIIRSNDRVYIENFRI
tara:strand:+ start:119 stop:676 length:558 start_codon:yes stop_codon:yes gene_type:complete